ncbi:hypothetical protein CC79DRAFT_1370528 [Sarocladium strictum]
MPPVGLSCRECRARKVKCDRTPVRCRVCIRLDLDCSFGRPSDHPVPRDPLVGETDLTLAGTKRKRTRRACLACRGVKAKCIGGQPCERCISKQLVCEGIPSQLVADGSAPSDNLPANSVPGVNLDSRLDARQPTYNNISPLSHDKLSTGVPRTIESTNTASTAAPPSYELDDLDRVTTRSYLEAYFEEASRFPLIILHKSTLLADWSRGRLDPSLLKIILTTVQYRRDGHPGGTPAVRQSMDQVQRDALSSWCRYTLTQLQILVLLARLRSQAGDNVDVWNLLPLTARIVFTLRLNHEQEVSQNHTQPPDAVNQECRRRLVWAIYHFDRRYSGGFEDLAVCPPEKIHIRVPCDEHTFRRGAHSRAGFLSDREVLDSTTVDIFAFLLRLSVIRDRILRYTKRLRRNGSAPTDHDLQALQSELDHFEATLPPDLKLSAERLMLMANSPESVKYMALHMQWNQSHCDLYRICVPGLREALPRDVLAETPMDVINRCQQNCLAATLRLCDLWSDMYRLEPSDVTNDAFLSISIYLATQTVRHLRHLLSTEGPNTLSMVKERLEDAVRLARPLEIMPRPGKCLKDAEKVIRALEEGTLEHSSRASSEGADVSRHYLPSKHTLLPHFSQTSKDEAAGPTPSPSVVNEGSATIGLSNSSIISNEQEPAARIMLGLATGPIELDRGLAAWDPFDMQMTNYHDADLETM